MLNIKKPYYRYTFNEKKIASMVIQIISEFITEKELKEERQGKEIQPLKVARVNRTIKSVERLRKFRWLLVILQLEKTVGNKSIFPL